MNFQLTTGFRTKGSFPSTSCCYFMDIDNLNGNGKFSKNRNKDPLMIDISVDDVKKTIAGELMDELGLERICCRKVMLTSIDIIDEI